jgi:tetratricopeptide (TPR) repeat protein
VAIDRERILQAAQKYVDKKKYDRAVQEYQKIVQEDPNDARTLLKIGDLQSRMLAFPEAIATYDRVGQFYASKGFSLKAIAVYKQIRELIRKHAPELTDRYGHILPKLAEIYAQLGLTSDALAAYDEVATRLQKAGRDRDAIDVFRKMVELDATNPLPHLRLAEACCHVQSVDEAIDSFWTAADMLLKMQRPDDALRVTERILHFRQDPQFARVAADLYLRRGDRDNGLQALAKLQIAFQADPKDLDTLGLLAQAFNCIGQENKAIEVYKEMARLAREQRKGDLYTQLLGHLRSVAPHDEQVRALESLRPQASHPPTPHPSTLSDPPIDVDDDVEFVDENEVVSEAPPPVVSGRPRQFLASAPEVMVDDEIEGADEFIAPGSFDANAHAHKAVVDAESFRKLRLYSKSIEALHIALEIDPQSIDIRHKLREVLVEAGEREAAIQETVNIAIIHADRGEHELAEPLLYEVLEIEPEHVDALQLLDELAGDAGEITYDDESIPDIGYDADQPLPSYDLEGTGADHASTHDSVASGDAMDSVGDAFVADAPFGMDGPLPSFSSDLADDDASDDDLLGVGSDAEADDEVEPEVVDEETTHSRAPRGDSAAAAASADVEEVLEEAEFFTSRGLFEDAKAILEEQLDRSPNHPLLMEKLEEVRQAMGQKSRTLDRRRLKRSRPPARDRSFDIAASLDALDDLEQAESEAPPMGAVEGDVDVDQVFEKFKEGVRAQVSEGDSSTHYDLGVAYKEMGLLSDACQEFELAARDPVRQCMCFAMIGMIHAEKNELLESIRAYEQALNAKLKNRDQEHSLHYDLGLLYERMGERKKALESMLAIERQNPDYRDVRQRVRDLRAIQSAPPSQSRAVNADDEFDAVFNDLFEGK